MADVRSKNLYELLGNDPELDPNRAPEPPTRALDKPVARHGKRDAPKEAPARPEGASSAPRRGGRATGNEAAFRDRNAGTRSNREKPTEEGGKESNQRFDRGGRPARRDRQSRTGQNDTRKQVNQGWGNQDGEKTWDDEKAAENIAKIEENEPQTPAEEEEPADKSKSLADYLAEKAARGDLSAKPVRAANEGSKSDKKWADAKEFKRNEDEEYIQGQSKETKGGKQRKEKNYLDVDMRFVEAPRTGGSSAPRGGRGGRGGRGAGRGDRGSGRGGRGGAGPRTERTAPVTVDEKNFPSLGGK